MKIRPIFKTIDIFSFIQFLSRQTNYIIKFFLLKVLYLVFIRRLYYKRGITKLVAPNLNFKDIIIHENDSLKCIGTITGIAHGCRWE